MIDLDITLLIQFVNFLITLVVLNLLLVRPIREVIKKRNDKMSGLLDEAEKFSASAEEKLRNYEAELAKARSEATSAREVLKSEGVEEEKKIVESATEQAQASMRESRKEIESQKKTAMDALRSQVDDLAGKVAGKVLS